VRDHLERALALEQRPLGLLLGDLEPQRRERADLGVEAQPAARADLDGNGNRRSAFPGKAQDAREALRALDLAILLQGLELGRERDGQGLGALEEREALGGGLALLQLLRRGPRFGELVLLVFLLVFLLVLRARAVSAGGRAWAAPTTPP
jgi:hypothetical protein